MSIVWQWPPADLPSSTIWLGLHDCRSSVEGHYSKPGSGNLCSDMADENCAIIEGLHPEAGVTQPVATSFKPMGSSFPPPPVSCVCHTGSKWRQSNDLYFFPPPRLFFSARQVPWLSLLCSFTNTSTSWGHQELWMGTARCQWKRWVKQFGLKTTWHKKGMFKPDREKHSMAYIFKCVWGT